LVQILVSNGHYFGGENEGNVGIRGYTLAQFELFLDAVENLNSNERFDRIEEIAIAARTIFTKFESVMQYLRSLRNGNKRK